MWFRNSLTTSKQIFPGSFAGPLLGAFVGLLLCVIAPVAQAAQYWVSLGSYSQLEGAETVRDGAASTFSQLSVIPSDSPIGLVYRVMEGPSPDRASAELMLDQARSAGFVDAWIVADDSLSDTGSYSFSESDGYSRSEVESSAFEPSASESSTYESSTYESSTYESSAYESSAYEPQVDNYSPAETQYEQAFDSSSPDSSSARVNSTDYNSVSIGQQELVESAPPGYGLHQLNRVGTVVRDGEVVESRLRALDLESSPESLPENLPESLSDQVPEIPDSN